MTLLGLLDTGLCYQLFCYVLHPWREARAVWRILQWIIIGKGGFSLDGLALFILLGCSVAWMIGVFIGLSQSTKAISYLVLCKFLLRTWVLCQELPHFFSRQVTFCLKNQGLSKCTILHNMVKVEEASGTLVWSCLVSPYQATH